MSAGTDLLDAESRRLLEARQRAEAAATERARAIRALPAPPRFDRVKDRAIRDGLSVGEAAERLLNVRRQVDRLEGGRGTSPP